MNFKILMPSTESESSLIPRHQRYVPAVSLRTKGAQCNGNLSAHKLVCVLAQPCQAAQDAHEGRYVSPISVARHQSERQAQAGSIEMYVRCQDFLVAPIVLLAKLPNSTLTLTCCSAFQVDIYNFRKIGWKSIVVL